MARDRATWHEAGHCREAGCTAIHAYAKFFHWSPFVTDEHGAHGARATCIAPFACDETSQGARSHV